MDKNIVMTRCRKVFVPLRNNRIFKTTDSDHEAPSVDMYRDKIIAERTASIRHMSDRPEWVTKTKPPVYAVGEFYLIPAEWIEK